MRTYGVGIFIALALCACGGSRDGTTTGTTSYRLVEGSRIEFAGDLATSPIVIEPATGTFEVQGLVDDPNAIFHFLITMLRFETRSYEIVGVPTNGATGGLAANDFAPYAVEGFMTVGINGEEVMLSGGGPRDYWGSAGGTSDDNPPIFRNLQLSGSGYTLTIFAIPNG